MHIFTVLGFALILLCADIDECTNGSDNCDAKAVCTNTHGSFTCTCQPGYAGNGVNCTGMYWYILLSKKTVVLTKFGPLNIVAKVYQICSTFQVLDTNVESWQLTQTVNVSQITSVMVQLVLKEARIHKAKWS